jgi:putative peptidoglycan lipid II flippase
VLSLGVAAALPDRHVVAGLAVATSVSYVVGAVLGEALLRRRLGRLDTRRLLRASGGFLVVSVLAGLAAWAVLAVIGSWLGLGPAASVVAVVLGSAAALAVLVASTLVWRSTELDAVLRGLRSRTDGSSGDGNSSVRPGRHRRG